jgi:hypothetical protein
MVGPALVAAAMPVSTKMPVPMITPIAHPRTTETRQVHPGTPDLVEAEEAP